MDNAEVVRKPLNKQADKAEKSTPGTASVAVARFLSSWFFVAARERFAFEWWGFVIVLLALALVGSRVYFRGKQANEGLLGRPLRVGIVSWPGYAGGLVANNGLWPNKDSDFWKQRNLLVHFVIIEDENQLREAFERGGENGGIDVMWSTIDSLAHDSPELLNKGIHPRAFMQVDWSQGGDAIVVTKDIERIEDLKGRKIAAGTPASLWLFESSIENSSLREEDKVAIRQARYPTNGSQEAREKFLNTSVDAAVLWEPDVTMALKRRGSHVLLSTKTAANLIADVMVAKEEFIAGNPQVIESFIEGWLLDGTPKAIGDPMLAVRALQKEPGFEALGEEATHDLLGKVAWASLDDNVKMFGLSGGESEFDRLFTEASRLWLKGRYITTEATPDQARHIQTLKQIYEMPAVTKSGCGPEFETISQTVSFPAGKTELDQDGTRVLNDLNILKSYSKARICVQATADDVSDIQQASNIKIARAKAVIRYLSERYDRPWSQFIIETDNASPTHQGTVSVGYVRLKLIANDSDQR